jgi:hypothetical protein
MERQIAHGVGPSDEPWPLLFAFIIFIVMLVPFMIHWPDSKVVQREHDTRDWLKDQLMERSNQIDRRPRTYARQ